MDATGIREVGMRQVGILGFGMRQVGIHELGMRQVGIFELGMREVGILELGMCEVGIHEAGVREVGIHGIGIRELRIHETGVREVRIHELGMREARKTRHWTAPFPQTAALPQLVGPLPPRHPLGALAEWLQRPRVPEAPRQSRLESPRPSPPEGDRAASHDLPAEGHPCAPPRS